jgi:hypothetical protein
MKLNGNEKMPDFVFYTTPWKIGMERSRMPFTRRMMVFIGENLVMRYQGMLEKVLEI